MKFISFAFFVSLLLVLHMECNVKSSFLNNNNISSSDLRNKFIFKNYLNKTANQTSYVHFLPTINFNFTIENETVHVNKVDLKLGAGDLDSDEKAKKCLKNITQCREEDKIYKKTASKLTGAIFSSLPPLDLSNIKGITYECQKQSKYYIEDLKNFKFWALKMYDATAKLPSGILSGNVNQLGDYDECLASVSEELKIQGKYCLPTVQIRTPQSSYLSGLHRLLQSHRHFKSDLDDPGHRVPKFSAIQWALCVPSACTVKDVETGLKTIIEDFTENTDLQVQVDVQSNMCDTWKPLEVPKSSIIVAIVFAVIIGIILIATLYDFQAGEIKNEWLVAFSLKKNVSSLISLKKSPGDIESVHGIRCVNAVLLILAHKSLALFYVPYVNRTQYVEIVAQPWTVLGRAASLYTDPFIMLSGMLTAYSLIGRLQKTNRISIIQEYISRLFRIVPTFAALIAFCTFILPWTSSGPMWNQVVTHHSNICKQYWWRNLLFIHNYFGFKDMCLTHTHHVGIDTQLFFTSPFMILLLWKWPKRGAYILIFIATISTAMRYYVTYTMRLSNYIHFGTSIKQLFNTADNMYILPAHRATVYIMGIFLGYILRHTNNMTLTPAQRRIGDMLAFFSFVVSYIGPAFMGSINYVYNPTDAAWYAAIAPIFWCASFAWIIFKAHLGYKGILGNFFSWPVFSIWTRISYTVYLTQFPVFFFNIGKVRNAVQYEFFSAMFNVYETGWIIALSAVLTLVIEMPFQNVRNVILKTKTTGRKVDENLDAKKKIS